MWGRLLVFLFGILMPIALSYAAAGHLSTQNLFVITVGAIAFSLMAVNLVMAARLPLFDGMFGGLDQLYFVHKWTGISVLVFALLHENVEINTPGQEVTSGLSKLSLEVAEIALIALSVLILTSFIKRIPKLPFEIPYHWWRWTHRLLGLVFIALAFHQFFVKAPFDNNVLLASYLNILALAGIASFVWSQCGFVFRRRGYKVTRVEKHPAATIVDLEPTGRGIRVRPGGFAFVSIKANGLREPHPFTVSEIRENGGIQFSIRGLGDYTKRLRDLVQVGQSATVEGGYGRFNYARGGDKQVWVAAGIGITPFLAMADSLPDSGGPEIHLIHCVRNESEVVGLERLRAAANRADGFHLHIYESDTAGRFDVQKLRDLVPFDMPSASFWFCGPAPMRVALVKALGAGGAKPHSVHYEKFEFR